jgi:hypothetical protein
MAGNLKRVPFPADHGAHDDREWLTVKFLHRGSYCADRDSAWIRQFPKREPTWGACRFTFDPEERIYDWLVVYHDLPRPGGNTPGPTMEKLACSRNNTMHVTYEPSSITTYGHAYLRQYGHVLTSQEPSCIRHPGMIHSQPGCPWFYGKSTGGGKHLDLDELAAMTAPEKTKLLSTVCSTKRQKHTAHGLRYGFTQRLKKTLPEMEVFGLGVRPIEDKAEALDCYKYHLAIENHRASLDSFPIRSSFRCIPGPDRRSSPGASICLPTSGRSIQWGIPT